MSNSHAGSPAHYSALPASGHRASWTHVVEPHSSHVDLLWENEGWTANGVLGSENAHFVIRMSAMWVVQQFLLFRDMDEPDLWLATDGHGRWGEMNGAHRTELDGCVDIDLRGTPFTNVIPIRRLPLLVGHSAQQNVITIEIETLAVVVKPQMYTRVNEHTWRYFSFAVDSDVEVVVDDLGFVIDEPNSFVRVTQ
jgi:hypothetical protein